MKGLLLDENVPQRLCFDPGLPLIPVVDILGKGASDLEVWKEARERECVILTKDTDYSDRALVETPPPWVVRLCFGNMRRHAYHGLLAQLWPQIIRLLPSHKLVNVYEDRLIAVR